MAIFHLFTHHVSFTHSTIERHLDCFYALAIVYNASVNTGVRIYFELVFSYCSDKYPEEELLAHMVVPFLIFEESPHCFPQWLLMATVAISNPGKSAHRFPFPHILTHTGHSCPFHNSHSNWCEVTSQCGFDLHFLNN